MQFKTTSRSMFNHMDQPFFSTPLQVTCEMIDPQHNDAVVITLENLYNDLLNNLKTKAGKKAIFQVFDQIDKTIFDRFGIPVKHIISPGTLYASLPIPPTSYDVLIDTNMKNHLEHIKDLMQNPTLDKIKPIDTLSTVDDQNQYVLNVLKSFQEMEKALGKGIIVNNKNAKIIGLPKDYVCYLKTDPDLYVGKATLTARELTAILLHEVGHCYNEIAYSYKLTRDATVLADTFLDNIRNKNNSPKESLLIAYSTAFQQPDVLKLRDKNIIQVGLSILHLHIQTAKATTNNNSLYTSERLADQFATKFGLGKELVTGLDNFNPSPATRLLSKVAIVLILIPVTAFLLFLIAAAIVPMISTAGVITLFLTSIFWTGLMALAYNIFFPDSDIFKTLVHGDDYTRFKAIKEDAIRDLRSTELKKDEIKRVIESIDAIDRYLKEIPKPSKGPLEAIINFLNGGKQKEMRKIDELIGSLSENDLHLAAAKLSTLA